MESPLFPLQGAEFLRPWLPYLLRQREESLCGFGSGEASDVECGVVMIGTYEIREARASQSQSCGRSYEMPF